MFRYYFTKILRVKSILNGSPVLFFLFVQFAAVNGQYSTPLDTLINFKTATVDPLGCIFYATGSNEIVKLGLDGKRSAFYSNNSLGNVKTIDVTNPFKILVFYPEFYTIVFLDRQLVEINRQNLMDRGFGEILLAGHSRDGHIWLFDELDHKLKKMNLQGNTIAESGDLRLTLGKQIIPVRIREHSDKVYVITQDNEILTFDLFANYLSSQHYPDALGFQISGDYLFLFKDSQMEISNLKTGEIVSRSLPESYINRDVKLLISNGILWCITDQSIKSIDKL